jgi:Bifunctional DNA primase/polymerase, N-terminal
VNGSAREHALSLVKEFGWSVFRLNVRHDEGLCDGGTANCKMVRPLGSWPKVSSNDPDVVGAWDWSGANGYGIDCGKSGVFVVDVDPLGEWSDEDTRIHSTGRGLHYFYEDLIGLPSGQNVWPHVDTRGVGGMVIGPGSWHPHGDYAIVREGPPAPLPAEVYAAVTRPKPKPTYSYDGPEYDDLSPEQRASADRVVEATIFDWSVRLATAANWDERVTDHKGRGWERLAADCAFALMCRALSPWTNLDLDDAEAAYRRILPDAIAANARCAGKWDSGRVARARTFPAEPPPWLDPVFDATPVLRHVRQAAHSREMSARGLLVCTLARLAVVVPLDTKLPDVIGARAPINLGVALVGGSGDGKSVLFEISRELLGLDGVDQRAIERVPGSGEGLIETWLGTPQDDGFGGKVRLLIADPRRLFFVDEVGQLGAVKDGRSGSTLGPVLRSMLTGGMLGTENADVARRRHVPAGAYRAALVVGVQPDASDVLLNDYDVRVGTPQRLTWTLTADPTLYALTGAVEWPGPLEWRAPTWPTTVEYPEHVKAEIRRVAREKHNPDAGAGDELDGHAMLTRLKVAALLAALHGEAEITDLWWRLAGVVAGDWTDEAIAACRAASAASKTRQAATAGRLRGHSRLAEEGVVEEDRQRKEAVAKQILAVVADAGADGVKWSDLRRKVRSTSRAVADQLVGTPDEPGPLAESGQVRLEAFTYRGQDGMRVYPGGES